MPNYEYECKKCMGRFESFQRMADNKLPETQPCPLCGALEVKQECFTVPGMKMDPSMDVGGKATGGFKEVMKQITQNIGIKGTKAESYYKNRYNL